MTLHKIKETLVEEKQMMTNKQLNILVAKVGLTTLGVTLDIVILTLNLLGLGASILVLFCAMFAFSWIFDMLNEDEETLKVVRKYSNLYILFYALLVVEFLVLKYFRFF